MNLTVGEISTRELGRELLSRVPGILRDRLTRRRAPAAPAAVNARAARSDDTVFATFARADAPALPLSSGYRARIKGTWRGNFWPVRVLLHVDRVGALPPDLHALADTLRGGRTLTVPLPEIAAAVQPLAAQHADLLVRTGRLDPLIDNAAEIGIVPSHEELDRRVAYQLQNARRILSRCVSVSPVPVEQMRVLEQGCGDGHTTAALATLGVRESAGVDVKLEDGESPLEVETTRQALNHVDARAASAKVHAGDGMSLPFPDASFDVVHSTSTIEHITQPLRALREAHRVLTPGGIAYFDVNPWFGPGGGHGLCTLDCPWGHVRLSAAEFETYIQTHRPYEAAHTLAYYNNGFQSPRLTLTEIERLVVDASFRIIAWHENRDPFLDHYRLITPEVMTDCRRFNPNVAVRDLMCSNYVAVLAKA